MEVVQPQIHHYNSDIDTAHFPDSETSLHIEKEAKNFAGRLAWCQRDLSTFMRKVSKGMDHQVAQVVSLTEKTNGYLRSYKYPNLHLENACVAKPKRPFIS